MEIISIIIPVYNEAENLSHLVASLKKTSQLIEERFSLKVEFVFVDDGSSDNCFSLLKGMDFGGHETRLLSFSRNFGKESALSAGIDTAKNSAAAILMDADLQHPPEMILNFIEVWKADGADSVYAYKANRRESEGMFKAILSKSFFWLLNYGSRYEIKPNAGDFRLLSNRFMNALCELPENERFMKGLYGWMGFKQIGIPFKAAPRVHGQSKFNAFRLLAMSLDAITSFTTAPLRLMALTGGVIALFSGLYGAFIVIQHYFFPAIPSGVASILSLIAFFGGIQILFLGLLGEYIGKAVLEVKKRPPFILAEDIRLDGKPRCE